MHHVYCFLFTCSQPLTDAVHVFGALGPAERVAGPLRPQHLLREAMGAERRRAPTRAQHRPAARHTECIQKEEHVRKSTGSGINRRKRGNHKYSKCDTVEVLELVTEEMGKFHIWQTLACSFLHLNFILLGPKSF